MTHWPCNATFMNMFPKKIVHIKVIYTYGLSACVYKMAQLLIMMKYQHPLKDTASNGDGCAIVNF